MRQSQFPQELVERLNEILREEHLTLPATLTKFQTIALPLVERGFWVTPVRPDGKAGAAGAWQFWQYRTVADVLSKYVERYADCNAGVVGLRGRGNLMFLDNDGGVPEDIIARLPKTYIVASRPDSVHKHHYFTQTSYSLEKFGRDAKTINIRDVAQIVPSPSGGVMYKTLFDVKGIGGASLVVAAGSTKPNGDVYTCIDDSPVAEVPNWLVDWILSQQRVYHKAKTRMMQANTSAKKRAAKIPPAERERLRALGHPDGFDICAIDRRAFTQSRAFKLARLGIVGDALVTELISLVTRHIEGGAEYCQLPRAIESIRGIAQNAEEITEATRQQEMTEFYSKKSRKGFSVGTVIYGEIPVPVRKDVLRQIVGGFPDTLTCEQADALLADGLNLVGLKPYDKRRDKNALTEVRREHGFEVGPRHWTRTHKQPIPISLHITGEGTDTSRPLGDLKGHITVTPVDGEFSS